MTTQTLDAATRDELGQPGDEYHRYLADVILDYASEHGKITKQTVIYRSVMDVTGRTMSTVKNWLTYRVHAPDPSSLARIVDHWKIPAAAIFPPHLASLLKGDPLPHEVIQGKPGSVGDEQVLLTLYGSNDRLVIDKVLSKYTAHPGSALFVRAEGRDMVDEIRPDELMLVDTSKESINASGVYMLRFDLQEPVVVIRHVDRMLGEPSVRLSGGSGSSVGSEVVPLVDGSIPAVTVLGRVVGVLRQL